MIDSVPLIQNANDAQQINASIIAMKKASRELDEKIVKLNSLNSELDKKIALLDSGLNKEIEDRTEAINSLDVPSVGGSGKYISAISETDGKISATESEITSTVSSGNSQPVTSGGVANAKYTKIFDVKTLSVSGWYKIATFQRRNYGASISIDLFTGYYYHTNCSHKIQINFGWTEANVFGFAKDYSLIFDKVRICYNFNNVDDVAIYVHYSKNVQNPAGLNINAGALTLTPVNFETDSLTWENTIEFNLGSDGFYYNGNQINPIKEKQIRIDDSSGYSLYHGVYVKSIANFFANNGINYSKVVNIRQVNNGNNLYPYFFIAFNGGDTLKVFKFDSFDNTYVDIKVYYYD